MSSPGYIIGIDLGTTNCAMAYAGPSFTARTKVADFPIPQLVRSGEVNSLSLLPSCLYLPGSHELASGSTRLPWEQSPSRIVGEYARWQGARVPGRLVASAKSWLCHSGVDRSAPILPWGASGDVAKLSPVDASSLFLQHMASAWNHAHPDAPIAQQEVVITVPASFDESARALTINAARKAGLEKVTLVEEPQAAFYDFVSQNQRKLLKELENVRLALVVDVGGGTTDFTLIQVSLTDEGPQFRRIAVGDHLMLGGDNMDATLGRLAESKLVAGGRKLSATQWTLLLQSVRAAKEALLGAKSPDNFPIAIASEGSRLFGKALSTEIFREEAERLILEGFLPACKAGEKPLRTARMALQELGLPYAQDPGITRQLSGFLVQHAQSGFAALGVPSIPNGIPRPDAVLLNGGVFNSPKIVARLMEVITSWWPDAPKIRLLPHSSLELSVARGAVNYGLARKGVARKIGGGTAHALYVGLASDRNNPKSTAVCLIPRGHEEGQPVDLNTLPFSLTLGRPVQFPLFSTASDLYNKPGEVIEITEDFQALPPIHTLFKGQSDRITAIPVHLRGMLTELGTLELWCVSNNSDERWRLEFELRSATARKTISVAESTTFRNTSLITEVERIYGSKSPPAEARDVKQLFRTLERNLGPRETWRLPMLRELWGALYAGAGRRRRTADHERIFFQLLGYSLRPGFGYPLDEWRSEQTFKLFAESIKFHGEHPVWNEFWVMWRRIAGGLDEAQQTVLWNYLKPHLARRIPPALPKSNLKIKGIQPEGIDQMVRTAASLEHLDPAEKSVLGYWVVERLKDPNAASGPWAWVLGRVGARVPLYGSGHKTTAAEQAQAWAELLLKLGLQNIQGATFALVQLTRMTGDRTRDLDDDFRAKVVDALKTVKAPERWLSMVTEVTALETEEESQVLGDSLPVGLILKG